MSVSTIPHDSPSTETSRRFADLRFVVAPDIIYLPARLHDVPQLESRAMKRDRELARFLRDLDRELRQRVGVPYEVALNPRYGRYTIRTLDGVASRPIFVIQVNECGQMSFAPAPDWEPRSKLHKPVPWIKRYAARPDIADFYTLLSQRIARHNAKGGFYSN